MIRRTRRFNLRRYNYLRRRVRNVVQELALVQEVNDVLMEGADEDEKMIVNLEQWNNMLTELCNRQTARIKQLEQVRDIGPAQPMPGFDPWSDKGAPVTSGAVPKSSPQNTPPAPLETQPLSSPPPGVPYQVDRDKLAEMTLDWLNGINEWHGNRDLVSKLMIKLREKDVIKPIVRYDFEHRMAEIVLEIEATRNDINNHHKWVVEHHMDDPRSFNNLLGEMAKTILETHAMLEEWRKTDATNKA